MSCGDVRLLGGVWEAVVCLREVCTLWLYSESVDRDLPLFAGCQWYDVGVAGFVGFPWPPLRTS